MRRQSRVLKAEVIRELKQLAEGRPTEQQSLLERYMECPDWQLASKIIGDAVQASLRGRGRTQLPPPPGWMQPL
ncbi:hypothetical protein QQ054_37720 [Oscillatoria amoena NRMC-F 0135]|nr:hypothetical protein [Oscillatoria amoena NRMC-F 0135]